VANLINLAALASGESPETIAERVGDGGGVRLKQMLTETLNEYLRPFRQRRKELEADMSYIHLMLEQGVRQARQVGELTLLEVRRVMNMEF